MTPEQGWSERGVVTRTALQETWASLAAVGSDLEVSEWDRSTACPGWSVKDQFSHIIGIERMLLGDEAPVWNEPLGDHVKNDFAASLEPWVAVRRANAADVVLAEFNQVTALRLEVLAQLDEEAWSKVGFSPAGEVPYAQFMELRVFDSWVHEQDVRRAVARPGGSGGMASSIAVDRVQGAMGFVVGKKAAAPEGSVVAFDLAGPGHDERHFALVIRDGRAASASSSDEATVRLSLSSLDFVGLGCGRLTANEVDAAGGIGVQGDPALAQAVLGGMNFMI